MKNKKIYLTITLLLVLALSIMGVVQAHSQTTNNIQEDDWHEYMEEMHEEMTQNLDSESKTVADQMHSLCMGG